MKNISIKINNKMVTLYIESLCYVSFYLDKIN